MLQSQCLYNITNFNPSKSYLDKSRCFHYLLLFNLSSIFEKSSNGPTLVLLTRTHLHSHTETGFYRWGNQDKSTTHFLSSLKWVTLHLLLKQHGCFHSIDSTDAVTAIHVRCSSNKTVIDDCILELPRWAIFAVFGQRSYFGFPFYHGFRSRDTLETDSSGVELCCFLKVPESYLVTESYFDMAVIVWPWIFILFL